MRSFADGASYFSQGIQGLKLNKVKRFVIFPLLANLLLIGGSSYWLIGQLAVWKNQFDAWLPEWLQWLSVLFWPVVVIFMFLAVFYTFAILANWVAAPFNGLLSETVEKQVSKTSPPTLNIWKELPRVFGREFTKLRYFIPKALAMLILTIMTFWLPILSPFVTLGWFLFSAWMMAIQYVDYPFDNHATRFQDTLAFCRERRMMMLGFGSVVMLLTMVPFVNILIMPVAVIGATKLFVREYKQEAVI